MKVRDYVVRYWSKMLSEGKQTKEGLQKFVEAGIINQAEYDAIVK